MAETVDKNRCTCGHLFKAHKVVGSAPMGIRGPCIEYACTCLGFDEPSVDIDAVALPKFVTNGEQAMTLCKTCRDPVTVTDVNCSKCQTVASDAVLSPSIPGLSEAAMAGIRFDSEISLIGHNLAELPKLSPEARRRVAVYVKRFVDDTEPNRGAPVPDPVGIVEAYARCGASLRGLDRNQAKRVLLAVAAMLDVDLTTRA